MSVDFVATRSDTDEELRGHARLLTAVIADAIRAAGTKPTPMEIKLKRNMDFDTHLGDRHRSMWFLFSDDSPFELYATLIGLDHVAVREALLMQRPVEIGLDTPASKLFTRAERRHILQRYRWFVDQAPPMEAA